MHREGLVTSHLRWPKRSLKVIRSEQRTLTGLRTTIIRHCGAESERYADATSPFEIGSLEDPQPR
jgi:hypothetical protein